MLAVQVQYWDLQERKRHNLVSENQNDRNLNILQFDSETRRMQAVEGARHNLVTEAQGWSSIAETQRHNTAIEGIQRESNVINLYNADTNRMNAETNRMNAATNAAMIPISWYNAETSRMSTTNVNWYNHQRLPIDKMNAESNRMNAQSQAKSVEYTHDYQTTSSLVNFMNAETNMRNAETNRYNADINQQRANQDYEIRKEANVINAETNEIRKWSLIEQTYSDIWRNANESIKTGTQVVQTFKPRKGK